VHFPYVEYRVVPFVRAVWAENAFVRFRRGMVGDVIVHTVVLPELLPTNPAREDLGRMLSRFVAVEQNFVVRRPAANIANVFLRPFHRVHAFHVDDERRSDGELFPAYTAHVTARVMLLQVVRNHHGFEFPTADEANSPIRFVGLSKMLVERPFRRDD